MRSYRQTIILLTLWDIRRIRTTSCNPSQSTLKKPLLNIRDPSWQSSWEWPRVLNYLFNVFQRHRAQTQNCPKLHWGRSLHSVGGAAQLFPQTDVLAGPKHSTFLQVWNYLDLIFHAVCLAEHDSWWGAEHGTNWAHPSLNTLNYPGRSCISL